ncbi:MAG: hypothetical protein RLZZ337_148 [Bacteroidota bacterium]|jgi:hypothetical protein
MKPILGSFFILLSISSLGQINPVNTPSQDHKLLNHSILNNKESKIDIPKITLPNGNELEYTLNYRYGFTAINNLELQSNTFYTEGSTGITEHHSNTSSVDANINESRTQALNFGVKIPT